MIVTIAFSMFSMRLCTFAGACAIAKAKATCDLRKRKRYGCN